MAKAALENHYYIFGAKDDPAYEGTYSDGNDYYAYGHVRQYGNSPIHREDLSKLAKNVVRSHEAYIRNEVGASDCLHYFFLTFSFEPPHEKQIQNGCILTPFTLSHAEQQRFLTEIQHEYQRVREELKKE